MSRAYCRTCDAARDADGPWPGRCTTCRTPIEENPVPDLVPEKHGRLRVLFVGINPGVQTARARRHFANPQNAFWGALHESGITPRRLGPDEQDELLALGFGITNFVTRATPGSADIGREDIARGRERLARLVPDLHPEWLVFVGKQAFTMARRDTRVEHGEQSALLYGAHVFVLPSTSPANAAVSPAEKLEWFKRLAERLRAA